MPGSLPPLQLVNDPAVGQNFDAISRAWPAEALYSGTGSPAGAVTAGPGALYVDLATGQVWWHVSSTVGSSGWVTFLGNVAAGKGTSTGTSAFALPATGTLTPAGTFTGIAHGLAVTPTQILTAQADNPATIGAVHFQTFNKTATTFDVRVLSVSGVGAVTVHMDWLAFG